MNNGSFRHVSVAITFPLVIVHEAGEYDIFAVGNNVSLLNQK